MLILDLLVDTCVWPDGPRTIVTNPLAALEQMIGDMSLIRNGKIKQASSLTVRP